MKRIIFLLIVVSVFFPRVAFAHPLDETGDVSVYDQKQSLLFTLNETRFVIYLTFYPTEKIKVWETIDSNRDQVLSNEEKDSWMKKGQEASWIEKDGEKIYFQAKTLDFPEYHEFFGKKIGNIKIEFLADKPLHEGMLSYFYKGKDKSLEEITFEAKGQEGLKVQSVTKESPESISLTLQTGTQETGSVMGMTTNNRLDSFLNTYVKSDSIPLNLVLIACFIAFFLGALHALTPGHGKAIVASYLVGSKGTLLHALNLGVIVTITHTASVFLLGLAAILLSEYIVPQKVITTLNTISGLLVLGFGIYLTIRRIKRLKNADNFHHHHDHEHPHDHHHNDNDLEITWKNLLPLGISGGIVPCVDALAILIVAISLQKTLLGLILLIFFSLGLALALVAIGGFAVLAKETFKQKVSGIERFEKYVSIISALIVSFLGVAILLNLGV